MSDEEVEERLNQLKELKIPPREQEENKLLLAKGERLYEESLGDLRRIIEMKIDEFERVLDKQDKLEIQDAAKELKEFFNEIEEI